MYFAKFVLRRIAMFKILEMLKNDCEPVYIENRIVKQKVVFAKEEQDISELREKINNELSVVDTSIPIQGECTENIDSLEEKEQGLTEEVFDYEDIHFAKKAEDNYEQNQIAETTKPQINIANVYMSDKRTGDMPYYKLYNINTADYKYVNIKDLNLSIRLINRIKVYVTVDKLLELNDDTLGKIKGFGKVCFEELHSYFATLDNISESEQYKENENIKLTKELVLYKENLINGDFRFLNEMNINHSSQVIINKFKEAHNILDDEFIEKIVDGTPEVYAIMGMLNTFVNQYENEKRLQNFIDKISSDGLEMKADIAIKFFTDDKEEFGYLHRFVKDNNQSLRSFFKVNAEKICRGDKIFKRFILWCQCDFKVELYSFFMKQAGNAELLSIISQRAEGKVLDEIGKKYGITRERVRQKETKICERFNKWQEKYRIIFKVFVDKGEEIGLFSDEITDCFDIYSKEFVYLMKKCKIDGINYDRQLDMFVVGNISLIEEVRVYVDSLPKVFHNERLDEFVRIATDKNDYPGKIVLAVIENSYKKTGNILHRFRLTLAEIYADIIDRYYPTGIHIYDTAEIKKFRQYVLNDYGIDISDKSDRAIYAILVRIGILCGRGIYELYKEKPYISKELANRIHNYIEESDYPIFMTNTIFSVFEDELVAEGIDNKYFLQGVLRALYENEWVFMRDYISKDKSYTSVYSNIVGYIKNSKYPVSKEELQENFPGVTEIVINFATSDSDIINLFGKYIHSCRLKLTEIDVKNLGNLVEQFLAKKEVCHCRKIYDYVKEYYNILLTNNFIQNTFGFYSLLEYLFKDYYNFSRPYIAKKNAIIKKGSEIIRDIIKESECIDISEVIAFARENRVQIYSIRKFIDSCNDTHLLINNLKLASIEYTGITEQIAKYVEKCIINEIDTTVPIHQLKCIHYLPKINVEWDVWLIYSVLKKWSTILDVGTTDNKFKKSYPVVSPLGQLDSNMFR